VFVGVYMYMTLAQMFGCVTVFVGVYMYMTLAQIWSLVSPSHRLLYHMWLRAAGKTRKSVAPYVGSHGTTDLVASETSTPYGLPYVTSGKTRKSLLVTAFNMEYGVWSMDYGIWTMEYWNMDYGTHMVQDMRLRALRAKVAKLAKVYSLLYLIWNMEYGMCMEYVIWEYGI